MTRIEQVLPAYKAGALPLSYIGGYVDSYVGEKNGRAARIRTEDLVLPKHTR